MVDLRVYANRNALAYFALCLPALLLQVLFVLAILTTSVFRLSGIPAYEALAFQFLPWLILVFSLFAVVSFRSSLQLTLLVVSYFIEAILSGGSALAAGRYLLSPGETAAFVVAASFCCLIGFGYSRAARIGVNRARVSSEGPLPHQAVAVSVEFFFPAVVAIGLVVATVLVAGALKSEALQFPAPLSTVFADFVVSPIITIVIAALTLVVVRDLTEPWILYYTINREDALKIFSQEAAQMQARSGLIARLASGGVLFSAVATSLLLIVSLVAFGPHTVLDNLGPVFGIGKPTAEPGFLIHVNNAYVEFKEVLNTIIRLLWG